MNPETLDKFRSPAPCIGTWLSLGSAVVAEMASQCGFDWLLIDMEHGSMAEPAVLPMLQALQSHKVAAVVRIPSHEPSMIARVLDWGADGIMAPHVSSTAEAKNLVRATRYPPDGIRGYSSTVRAYGYGTQSADGTTQPLLLAQIECLEGVRNAEAIAGVPGVDVLFVGPADLQLSLSISKGAPGYDEALDDPPPTTGHIVVRVCR